MKKIIYLVVCCFFVQQANSQNPFICSYKCNNTFNSVTANCNFTVQNSIRQNAISSAEVNPYDEFNLIIEILKRDKSNPFPLLYTFRECATVCNAASVMIDSVQFILYNSGFLNKLKGPGPDLKWVVRSIIAHEIGHHILLHTSLDGSTVYPEQRQKQELKADYFSAFVIKQFPGSTIENAYAGLNSLDSTTYMPQTEAQEQGGNYPILQKRRIAIEEGFKNHDDSPLRIDMFREIDTIALHDYVKFGRSIIFSQIDKDIAINNPKDAKEKIDLLLQLNPDDKQKKFLLDVKKTIENNANEANIKQTITINETPIKKEDIEFLKNLYEKFKNSKKGTKEKEEAMRIEKIINLLEKQQSKID